MSLFGPKSVFVLSIDDKAKIPISVTAAKQQAPLIMHVFYEVRLPDHDFVKASKHKLTPSVYAGCELRPTSAHGNPEITYSGPTYAAIRSLKHESSTAYTHGKDFDKVIDMKEFEDLVKVDGVVKPIAILMCDGGGRGGRTKTHVSPKHSMLQYSTLRSTALMHFWCQL